MVEPRDTFDIDETLGLLGMKSGDDSDLLRTVMSAMNLPHKVAKFPIRVGQASDDRAGRITPDQRPGFAFLMRRLDGRTTTTLEELAAIGEEWKAQR